MWPKGLSRGRDGRLEWKTDILAGFRLTMIRIEVQTRSGQPMHELAADFDERGGTIGRAKESTLMLPDPQQHISRTQAVITFRAASCFLQDNGRALPTVVNGNPVGKGNEVPVRDGDHIDIGDYTLTVRLLPSAAHTTFPADFNPFASDADVARRGPPSRTPVGRSNLDVDPFADPFGTDTPPPGRGSTNVIPPDFDRYAGTGEPAAFSDALRRDDELPIMRSSTENLDSIFGLNEPGLAGAMSHDDPLAPATPLSNVSSSDPLSALVTPQQRAPASLPQRDDAHILSTPIPIPVPEPVAAPTTRADADADAFEWGGSRPLAQASGRGHADVQATGDTDELLRAFLKGAGVQELPLPNGLTPEVMHLIGQVMREAVGGTLELLVARALTKREMRARDITILVARENNPLKHSVTVEAALNKLLGPETQGFLPPVAAMRDAYRDLCSHQVGVMAGMRAALIGVLERFDPARLEKRLTQKGAINALMPSGRKARLWEMFEQLYTEISKEAEDDFETVFGRAFVKAYEAQIAKFKQEDGKD